MGVFRVVEILYVVSQYIALGAGFVLGFPYIGQLKEMLIDKKIDTRSLRDKMWFTIAILGFTFSAIMNHIVHGNLPMMLAQLFSAIPLILIHIIALIESIRK